MTTLTAREVAYFSQLDEDAFFAWIKRIRSVGDVRGAGHELRIAVDEQQMRDSDLRELIALFHRYGVDKRQLAQFVTEKNAGWFRDNNAAYWHKEVFGGGATVGHESTERESTI